MNAKARSSAKPPMASRALTMILTACCALLPAGAGCAFKKPTVKLDDIHVAGLDFQKLDLIFDLKVDNPNPFQISISGLEYDLTAVGERFAEGALPQPVAALGAGQVAHVRAPVALHYKRLLPLLQKLRSAEPIPYEFKTTLTFNLLGTKVPVPLAHAGRIPALRAPSWHFRNMQLVKGTTPVVKLVFDVENPNQFELPLKQLTGALQAGDKPLIQVSEVALAPVPAGQTATLTIPVQINAAGVARAVAEVLTERQPLRFEGELRLGSPASLRRMLLGQGDGED